MQAIVQDRFGSADVLELRDIDHPEIGPGEVLVRTYAAGVDRGVWHLMAGLPYPIRLAGYGFRPPRTPSPAPTSPAWSSTRLRSRRGGTARPGDRRLRRRRDRRGPDREGVRRLRHRRLQHLQGRPRPLYRRRRGHRLHPRRLRRVERPVRGDPRHRRQLVAVLPPQRPDPDRHARDRRGEASGRVLGGNDRQVRALVLSRFVDHTLGTFVASVDAADFEFLTGHIETGVVAPVMDRSYPARRGRRGHPPRRTALCPRQGRRGHPDRRRPRPRRGDP
jgi:hypothetical protein